MVVLPQKGMTKGGWGTHKKQEYQDILLQYFVHL